jgi:hypothetical protein
MTLIIQYKNSGKDYEWQDPREHLGARNTIELRAKTAIDGTPLKHLFFIYTNDKGQQSYIAGYPDHNLSLESLRDPENPFGEIVKKGGEYKGELPGKPGSPDFKPYVNVATISGDPQSVYRLYEDLKSQVQHIAQSHITYSPVQNSNSTAVTAAKNALANRGIKFELPADIKGAATPGSMNDLNLPKSVETQWLDAIEEAIFSSKELAKGNVSPEVLNAARGALQNLKYICDNGYPAAQQIIQTLEQQIEKFDRRSENPSAQSAAQKSEHVTALSGTRDEQFNRIGSATNNQLLAARVYNLNEVTKAEVDANPQLKTAISAAVVYTRLIDEQGSSNHQFQDFDRTATRDPQTEKLTVEAVGRGTLLEHDPNTSQLSIHQNLIEADYHRVESLHAQRQRGETVAQTPPPNQTQQRLSEIAQLSAQQLQSLSPSQLLAANAHLQKWEKQVPGLPHAYQLDGVRDNYETQAQKVGQYAQKVHQAQQALDELEPRTLLKPWGASRQEIERAQQSLAVAQSGLDYEQRHLSSVKSTHRDYQNKRQAHERFMERPDAQMMAQVKVSLGQPEVQEKLQEASATYREFSTAQKAAAELNRPMSYQAGLEQAKAAFMEEGKMPSPELGSSMERDMQQYQQAMAQAQRKQSGSSCERG